MLTQKKLKQSAWEEGRNLVHGLIMLGIGAAIIVPIIIFPPAGLWLIPSIISGLLATTLILHGLVKTPVSLYKLICIGLASIGIERPYKALDNAESPNSPKDEDRFSHEQSYQKMTLGVTHTSSTSSDTLTNEVDNQPFPISGQQEIVGPHQEEIHGHNTFSPR